MIMSDICYSKHLRLDWNYSLYLPDTWHDGADYPILYLLHGECEFHKEFILAYRLENIIHELKKNLTWADVIIAMPDGWNSYYINGPTLAMENAMMQEFIKHIEQRYTSGHRAKHQRMIAGFSMGGYGALRYAIHYPYQFALSYLVAPTIWVDEPSEEALVRKEMHLFVEKQNRFSVEVWQNHHPFTQLQEYQSAHSPVDFRMIGMESDTVIAKSALERAQRELSLVSKVKLEFLPGSGHHDKSFYQAALKKLLSDLHDFLHHSSQGGL